MQVARGALAACRSHGHVAVISPCTERLSAPRCRPSNPLQFCVSELAPFGRRPATTSAASAGSGGVSAATAAAGAAMAAGLAEAERRRQKARADADKAKFASDRVRASCAWLHGRQQG